MKTLLCRHLIAVSLCFLVGHAPVSGQTPIIPIAFGESLMGTLPTTSSTVSYATPYSQPGDVLFIRITPAAIKLQFELFAPSGAWLGTFPGAFNEFNQTIYPIPSNGESGNYKILVSNTGIWTGNFCITLQRMNEPPTAKFLGCGTSLQDTLQCGSSIRSFRYLVQQNTLSRITVAPNLGIAPEVWVCTRTGIILRHGTASYTNPIILDTLPASETNCYYVLVADAEGYWHDDFSISHTIISGACAAVSVLSIPSGGSLCEGDNFTLTASSPLPNAAYMWSGPNGFASAQPEIIFTNATPAQSGKYTVTVTTPGVCSSIASKTITVNPLPNAEATVTPASGMVCPGPGQSITLNVNASGASPFTYQWSKLGGGYNSTFKSPVISASSNVDTSKSGVYIIVVTDKYGCKRADSIAIQINPLPSAVISSPASGAVCLESTLYLNATSDAPNAVFLWSGPQGFSSTLQNPSIPNVSFSNGGTYYVTVTNTNTGCTGSTSKSISVKSLPTANIIGNLSICAGANTTLTATGGGTYLWSNGATTNAITVSPSTKQAYSVTVTSTSTGCTDSATDTVTVKPLPSFSISSTPVSPQICEGEGNILLCIIPLANADNPTYQWTGPGFFSNQQCVSFNLPSQTGNYQASVTSGATGCSSDMNLPVKIFASPVVEILPIPAGLSYCYGESFTLCANSDASAPAYEWSGPGGFTSSSLCVVFNNAGASQSGNYNVTVTDIHGCTGTSSSIVAVDNAINITADVNGNQITAVATGGTPPFSYSIAPAGQTGNSTGIFKGLLPGNYTITATDKLGCTASTSEIIITDGIVEPSTAWGLTVSPNPGSGLFEIRLKDIPADALQFDVFSPNGRLLRTFTVGTVAKMLDLTDLPDGLYLMCISDKNKTGAVRIVIAK